MVEQKRIVEAAYRAEGKPPSAAHFALQRFCCITEDRDAQLRFAENARYQARLASNLRRREEVMEGTMLVDRPAPDEPPLEEIRDNLLIGGVEEVTEKLTAEIRALAPAHFAFAFKVGSTPHALALRSTELLMTEVRPRLERALGPLDRIGAD
jgi:alkanesulfonate monooxygenase SsuD/methylene tetrahydromethanopterin reductase-like flavin-dependent oxidoreductase (luciferase family)